MPARRTTPNGYHQAHRLRKRSTPAEARLWAYLRGNKLGRVNFRRQHAIGPYVVDFCAPKHKLIIEVDGSPHLNRAPHDAARTVRLAAEGFRVLRIWNDQVMNDIDGAIRAIQDALNLI